MTARPAEAETVLQDFAIAYRRNPAELSRFCIDKPEYAREFVALAHELSLQLSLAADDELDSQDEEWIAQVCAARIAPATDPFAKLDQRRYAGLRQTLGVPAIVVASFRDRLVAAGTVPLPFLERLAEELRTSVVNLVRHLEAPSRIAATARFKADDAPAAAADKMSFEQILDDCGVSAEERLWLLGGD